MAGSVGREFKIKRNGVTIAGMRTKTVTINGTPVDVTTDDDDGFRRLLEKSGEKQIDLSIEGILKDDELVEALAATGGVLIEQCELEFVSGAKIIGDFRLNSIELGFPYNDATTFSGEMQSTGPWTMTPVTGS